MRRTMHRILALLGSLAVASSLLLAFNSGTAQAAVIYDLSIRSSSYCDGTGNCITGRIWLQAQDNDAYPDYLYRFYFRVWCTHSGSTIPCRAINSNSASLNAREPNGINHVYQTKYGDTCTSTTSCGDVVHDIASSWFIAKRTNGIQWNWYGAGHWGGCPTTGNACATEPLLLTDEKHFSNP